MTTTLEIRGLEGMHEIEQGAGLGELIANAARRAAIELADEHLLVVSQKIVSKAEGRLRRLAEVEPSPRARALAEEVGKDPRLVELILSQSRRVVRAAPGVLIVETSGGWICANAGIDASNLPMAETVALLPEDADASARRIRAELATACDARPGVIVADSFGRPWRLGQVEIAIGCAGVVALDDWRGREDAGGRRLAATAIAVADLLAGAAELIRDKASWTPVAVIDGAGRWRIEDDGPGAAAALQRPGKQDLFR